MSTTDIRLHLRMTPELHRELKVIAARNEVPLYVLVGKVLSDFTRRARLASYDDDPRT
jgi:predicted HicB family RNase H-like nuclease